MIERMTIDKVREMAVERLNGIEYNGKGVWLTAGGETLSDEDVNHDHAILSDAYIESLGYQTLVQHKADPGEHHFVNGVCHCGQRTIKGTKNDAEIEPK